MGINPNLIEALAEAPNGGSEAELRVYTELLKSNLLVPIQEPQENNTSAKIVTIPVRGRKRGLPVFTHKQAVDRWQAGWALVAELSTTEVCKLVLEHNLTAIVIDPAGPQWLELREAELEALVQGKLPLSQKESTAKSIEYFKRGSAIILPYLSAPKSEEAKSPAGLKELEEGIEELKQAVKFEYRLWQANWFLGKALQLLGIHEQACEYFEDAFSLNPDEPSVCDDLLQEYLELGRTSEAVVIAKRIVERNSKDAGLLANLGLAQFMNGQLKEAKNTVKQALSMNRNDPITKDLLKMIEQVEAGKRKQPEKFSDL